MLNEEDTLCSMNDKRAWTPSWVSFVFSRRLRLSHFQIFELMCLFLAGGLGFSAGAVYGFSLADPLDHDPPRALNEYYPAVFFAGGHGMGTADPQKIPGLEDFLLRRTPSFDVSQIPRDIPLEPMTTPFELTHIYHIYAVGLFWRIFGVSVRTLVLFGACLCGVSTCAVYAIFRLVLSRPVSLLGALLFSSSPAILYLSNNLREFGKTPFILIALWVLLRLIVYPVSRRLLIVLAVFLGIILGIGMGFRQDMILCIPPATVILFFFARIESLHPWRMRVLASLLFFMLFSWLARPVFYGASLEGNQASTHGFFQGLSQDIEQTLDFGGASYDGLYWTDAGLYAQANVLARRMGDNTPMVNPHTAEYRHIHGNREGPRLINFGLYYTGAMYSKYARLLMQDFLRIFPSDIVARAWRATIVLYAMPVHLQNNLDEVRGDFPFGLHILFQLHHWFSLGMRYAGLLAAIALLLLMSAKHLYAALCVTGLLLWFSGAPSIFFAYKYIAYLYFVPLGVFLIWAERIALSLYNLHTGKIQERCRPYRTETSFVKWFSFLLLSSKEQALSGFDSAKPVSDAQQRVCLTRAVLAMLCFVVLLTAGFLVPLSVLRWVQKTQVLELADRLTALPRDQVDVRMAVADGHISVAPAEPLPGLSVAETLPPGETAWEYVAAKFHTGGRDIPVTIEYDHARAIQDFSQQIIVWGADDDKNGLVWLFFPIYEASTIYSPELLQDFLETVDIKIWRSQIEPNRPMEEQSLWKRSRFLGLSFPECHAAAFQGFYRVTDLDGLVYLPIFQAPENRAFLRTHKTGPWERKLRKRATQHKG